MNPILKQDIELFARHFAMLDDELRNKTIVVTGATGLLGSCTIRCLLELNARRALGMRVIAVARSMQKAARMFGPETDELSFQLHDFASSEPFRTHRPAHFLLHFAAPTASRYFVEHPADTMNIVYNGARSVLQYAASCSLRGIVLASTLEVYGTVLDDTEPLAETSQGHLDPMQTRSSYPMAKRAAEALFHSYAAQYGLNATVARLAQTFGAGVDKNDTRVFAQFARNIIAGQDIVLHTDGTLRRCYCYTTDAVAAMLFVMLKGQPGQAYNVANPATYTSIRDMAQFLVRTFCPTIKVHIEPRHDMGYSPETRLRLDTSRLEALGWAPRHDLRTMFHRLIQSMK